MISFKLIYFVIILINSHRGDAQISDKRLCVDVECKVPISYAETLTRYYSPDSRILSFGPKENLIVYSKSAGSREDLWGAEINGKRGYVPKNLIRETKVLQKATVLVETEVVNDTQVPSTTVEPDKVQEPYEVIDGTTLYPGPQENIKPTVTDSPVLSTALPNKIDGKEEANLNGPLEEPATKATENIPDLEEEEDDDDLDDAEEEEDDDGDDEGDEIEAEETAEVPAQEVKEVTQDEHTSPLSTNDAVKTEDSTVPPAELPRDVPTPTTFNPKMDAPEAATPSSDIDISNTTTESLPNLSEAVTPTSEIDMPEVTTLSPQMDLPEPFMADTEVVTANPVEVAVKEIEVADPILPPLGLFNQNSEAFMENPENESATEAESRQDIIGSSLQEEHLEVREETISEGLMENSENERSNEIPMAPESRQDIQGSSLQEEHLEAREETISELPTVDAVVTSQHNVETTTEAIVKDQPHSGFLSSIGSFFIQESEEKAEMGESITQSIEESERTAESQEVETEIESNKDVEVEGIKQETQELKEILQESATVISESNEINNIDIAAAAQDLGNLSEELTSDPDEELQKESENGTASLAADEDVKEQFCESPSCEEPLSSPAPQESVMDFISFSHDIVIYLATTAVSVIIFLFGYLALDKTRRVGPLVAKINNLEKELLIVVKENQILQEKASADSGYETNDKVSSEVVDSLRQDLLEVTKQKNSLEEQVQTLEKELENSTEVGIELNRMLSDILSSENGSDALKANVEHLQRQLVEQQSIINSINETLAVSNTENHELRLELELSNKKVHNLQEELDKLLLNVLKMEEEKELQQNSLESQIAEYRRKYEEISARENEHHFQKKELADLVEQTDRKLNLKTKEHAVLADTVKQLKAVKNSDGSTLAALLEVTQIKAECELLKSENQKFRNTLQQEQEARTSWEKRAQLASKEAQEFKQKYDETDKLRVETDTKLEVLSNYFKEREAQLQKEISKHESLWVEKQGEATSTTERITFMQEQLQIYKAQTESLKQEIMSQEVELKSQISVLEKKVHENWVSARQVERKLEESKQEAAQLRHRLTLRERAIQDDKNQHRLQSPIEQNGGMPESPASPPLLFDTRDHITKSPQIPGLPHFLPPPPPGVPFMPPPLAGVPPFMPPPPNMFPGDHRPPPLGRMSSPPLNPRYSPSSRGYSPYDDGSSPSDSEYGVSPPQRRGYSPFTRGEDRREYKRPPPPRSNGRSVLKGGSSGNSNESLEKINRQQSKV